MEKVIQITLTQQEANLILQAVEAFQDTVGMSIEDTDKLRELSLLWDKVFDTGIRGGFGVKE